MNTTRPCIVLLASFAFLAAAIARGQSQVVSAERLVAAPSGTVSVVDFGASPDAGSPAERREAMQAAIDAAAGVAALRIPAGQWEIDRALQWRAGSHLVGDGIDLTVIRLCDDAHEDSNVLEPADKDSSVVNWRIEGLTLDGNYTRPTVSKLGRMRPGSSCLATMGARYGVIRQVKVKDAVLHGLDVCNGGEVADNGRRNYVLGDRAAPDYYPDNESQFIWIDQVYAENCGDDAITGHYSRNIFVGSIVARSDGGRHTNPIAGNAVEIDDGCRRWFIDSVTTFGGNRGFASKNHTPQPAPSDIVVGRIHATGAHQGVYLDGGGKPFDSGYRISIGQIVVTRPTPNHPESTMPFRGVYLRSINDVSIGSILVQATGEETMPLESAVHLEASQRVSIGQIVARNWSAHHTDDRPAAGVFVNAACASVSIGQVTLEDGGNVGVLDAGSARAHYGHVTATLSSPLPASTAVRLTVDPRQTGSSVGAVVATGYEWASHYGDTLRSAVGVGYFPGDVAAAGTLRLGDALVVSGAGSPEGVIAAPPGSTYLRSDGGDNSTLYVKTRGDDTAGWRAVTTAAP